MNNDEIWDNWCLHFLPTKASYSFSFLLHSLLLHPEALQQVSLSTRCVNSDSGSIQSIGKWPDWVGSTPIGVDLDQLPRIGAVCVLGTLAHLGDWIDWTSWSRSRREDSLLFSLPREVIQREPCAWSLCSLVHQLADGWGALSGFQGKMQSKKSRPEKRLREVRFNCALYQSANSTQCRAAAAKSLLHFDVG